jgi:hypothetical protein
MRISIPSNLGSFSHLTLESGGSGYCYVDDISLKENCTNAAYAGVNYAGGTSPQPYVLGEYGVTTVIDGGALALFDPVQFANGVVNFSGNYLVKGPLVFKNGTFNFTPGTVFYVEPDGGVSTWGLYQDYPQNGGTRTYLPTVIDVEGTATFNLNGATFTSTSCSANPKWGGLRFTGGATLHSSSGTLNSISRRSEINKACLGLAFIDDQTSPVNSYFISETNFFDNDYGFYESRKQAGVAGQYITNCEFSINTFGIYFYGLFHYPEGDYTGVTISGNYLHENVNGVYGITSNLNLYGNEFFDHSGISIYLNSYGFGANPTLTNTIEGNYIVVAPEGIGVMAGRKVDVVDNVIDCYDPVPGLYGIVANNINKIEDNTVSNFSEGLKGFPGGTDGVTSNYFLNNQVSVALEPNAYSYSLTTLRCNTFDAPGIPFSRGIWLKSGSFIDGIGTSSQPSGNRFRTLTEKVFNEGVQAINYYTIQGSLTENLTIQNGIKGNPGGFLHPVTVPGGPTNFCGGGNGVNARSAKANFTFQDIKEMMDSLQMQLGSFARQKQLQRNIIDWHTDQNQLPDLEQYFNNLQGLNKEAYNTLALYLMDTYRDRGNEQNAQLIKNALLFYNPRDFEVLNRTRYFDLVYRITGAVKITTQDSTMLVALANSGTSFAQWACINLNFFYPKYGKCTVLDLVSRITKVSDLTNSTGMANLLTNELGLAFPNPAQTEAVVPFSLPQNCKSAKLTINEVVTGRQVKIYSLSSNENHVRVDLRNLPNGLYTYSLTLDGKPVATRKLSVVR